jgi:hypothetical protein
VGIAASGPPEWNRVDRGGARETNVTSLIAHGSRDLADRLIRPYVRDLNPACDFLAYPDRFDELPLDGKKNRARTGQVFGNQGIQDSGCDTALHDQFAKN